MRKRPQWLLPLIGALSLLALWQVAFWLKVFNSTLLPDPYSAFKRLAELIVTGNILPDFGWSLARMLLGYLLAVIVGVASGTILGLSATIRNLTSFLLDFFRSLPVTTLYPLFVLFFGIGHNSKIAMVFAACLPVIVINVIYGISHAKKERAEMAMLFGASAFDKWRLITFFDALPQTLIGMRISLSYALIVEIVCEMFMGSQHGLGQRVFEAYNTYFIAELYALVIFVGGLGYFLNIGFVAIEKRVVHWPAKS